MPKRIGTGLGLKVKRQPSAAEPMQCSPAA